MRKICKIISALMAGLTLFSMAPVNAETYTGEVVEDEVTQTESPETSNSTKISGGGVLDNTISWLRNLFLPQVFAAEDDIARGTSGGVTWVIDSEGTLTLSPTNGVSGKMRSLSEYYDGSPWYRYRTQIKKAVAEPGTALNSRASGLFYECSNLVEIELGELDVSDTTDMGSMFSGCDNLVSLNSLEKWDVSNVSNMSIPTRVGNS